MEKKTNIATVILFWAALAVLSLGSLLKKDGLFSENENRSLTQRPSLSLTTVLDGSFQEELESYLQDQILFRDGWNALHSAALLAIGDCDINGAYVGEAGYDFEKITEADVDQKRFHTNTRAIRIFLERQQQNLGKGKVSFMLVPTAARLLPEMVPDGAPLFDQDRRMDELFGQLKGFRTVDLRKVFGEAADGKDLYYYTDHHWTTHGAYLAYASWRKNAPKESDYEVSVVSDRFRGSLYSKVLNENSPWDTVERFDLKGGEEAYTVFAGDDKLDGLYDETKLKEKDKYAYFLGGNVGL
ncbi:MAG: hypothetical protein IJ679_10860 [Lachnospiraceae bacterium]|nr:hypothetical protein [Lachnospiraceae bacterium]